jgi:hypothetical protein
MHTIQQNRKTWMDVLDIKEFIVWLEMPVPHPAKEKKPAILLHRRKTMEGANGWDLLTRAVCEAERWSGEYLPAAWPFSPVKGNTG